MGIGVVLEELPRLRSWTKVAEGKTSCRGLHMDKETKRKILVG